MKYSFDDYAIGLMRKDGRSLLTREIKRPRGITNSVWYEHTKEVCKALNKDRS